MPSDKLEVSPLPWTAVVTGRDTPNGCAVLMDADKRNIIKPDSMMRRDDAQFIVRTIADRAELHKALRNLLHAHDLGGVSITDADAARAAIFKAEGGM